MRFASQATTLATLLAGACYTASVHAAGRKLMTGLEETGTIFESQFGSDADIELALAAPEEITGKSAPLKGRYEGSIRRKTIAAPIKCTTYDGADGPDLEPINNWDNQIVYNDKSGATLHVGCYVQEPFNEDDLPAFATAIFWEVPTDGAWFVNPDFPTYVAETSSAGRRRFELLKKDNLDLIEDYVIGDWVVAKADGSVAYQGAGYHFAIPTIPGLHQGNDSVLFSLTFDVTKARPSVFKSRNAPFKLLSNITYDPSAI